MDKRQNCKWRLLLVFGLLILLGFLLLLTAGFWMLNVLSHEQQMLLFEQQPMNGWSLWMEQGYGWPGFRWLIHSLFSTPLVLVILLLFLAVSIFGIFVWQRFFRQMGEEEAQIETILENRTPASADERIFQDSSSVLRIQENIQKRLEEEQRLFEKQRALTAAQKEDYENVLHQIRSKLSSIYFAIEDPVLSEPEKFQEIEAVTDECDGLLRAALKASIYQPLNLEQLVQSVLLQKRGQYQAKNLSVSCEVSSFKLVGDSIWINEVLDVLLSNAIEAAKPGSPLTIRSQCEDPVFILQIENVCENPLVADRMESGSGSGGNKERIDLMERYAGSGGSHFGIGLHLASQTMKAHHGQLLIKHDGEIFQAILRFPHTALEEYAL